MARNLGYGFWRNMAECLSGINTWENDFENAEKVGNYLDIIEKSVKTDKDKSILALVDVFQENNEFIEPYFKKNLLEYVNEVYKRP